MPEFILPDEVDKCSECGKVLTIPPKCCYKAEDAYWDAQAEDHFEDDGQPSELTEWTDYDPDCYNDKKATRNAKAQRLRKLRQLVKQQKNKVGSVQINFT